VSVPVLSEQMTVAPPRVSTAGNFLTIACRFAIREMALTAKATAASNILAQELPYPSPTANVRAAMPKIMYSNVRLNLSNFRVRGVLRLVPCSISWDIRPVSVASPMATTIPLPVPKVTKLPA